jgi:hypothetical protein
MHKVSFWTHGITASPLARAVKLPIRVKKVLLYAIVALIT